ncbi:MAG TPA: TetR/AcrR family transcriptional regulator [Xanthobacteraceae bacterium]|jgi:AcrR family transcriptional regulator|nr:TetR/AcrR family transcriptional regulator [Xanthobacteraceae bacterium]
MNALAQIKAVSQTDDSAKRRQIVEGARSIFLANGFDAASMNDIARAAGVSKGTLYVYFTNKEQLFEAIVHAECLVHAETTFQFDHNERDVEAALLRLGKGFIAFLCAPQKASALRTVIAIADRMPEIGKVFYETGPAVGIAKLSAYLQAQNEAGILVIDDCDVAAAQFLDSCQSMLFKPVLFNFSPAPKDDVVDHVVGIAVRTFLRSYKK